MCVGASEGEGMGESEGEGEGEREGVGEGGCTCACVCVCLYIRVCDDVLYSVICSKCYCLSPTSLTPPFPCFCDVH